MIGIYALWFEEPSLVYIGQSQDIEIRYKEHLRKLKNNTATNYKVQETYNQYGTPELVVLEQCSIIDLNIKEIEWTVEFNSIKQGLNIIEAGQVGFGPNSNSSKYTKRQILKVFSLLYKTNLSHNEIATKTNIASRYLVDDIKRGTSHIWLKEQYPLQYTQMKNRPDYKQPIGKCAIFINPLGEEITISNLYEYCCLGTPKCNQALRVGLTRVRSGERNTYKGWKLKKVL